MSDNYNLRAQVKDANREFHDLVADVYDQLGSREDTEFKTWLEDKIKKLKVLTRGECLLDLGCGRGFVLESAQDVFPRTCGIDISLGMLQKVKGFRVLCGEVDFLPVRTGTVDVVVAVALLHHLWEYDKLCSEIYRVLKKGGVLYIDQDPDTWFTTLFGLPLRIHKYLFGSYKKYGELKKGLTQDLFDSAEVHLYDGVDSASVLKKLKESGFSSVECSYHWTGPFGLVNRLVGDIGFPRGFAPYFRIMAKK